MTLNWVLAASPRATGTHTCFGCPDTVCVYLSVEGLHVCSVCTACVGSSAFGFFLSLSVSLPSFGSGLFTCKENVFVSSSFTTERLKVSGLSLRWSRDRTVSLSAQFTAQSFSFDSESPELLFCLSHSMRVKEQNTMFPLFQVLQSDDLDFV